MELNYYVYYHIRLDTNVVFYVGVGTKALTGNVYSRAYNKCNRTKFWKNTVNKTAYKVDFLKEFETKKEALIYETRLIEMFGIYEDGGNLVNFVRDTVNETRKSKLVDYNSRRRVKVYQYGLDGIFLKEFESLSSAAEAVNGLASDISQASMLKTKLTCKGYQWRYEKFDKLEPREIRKVRDEKLKKVYQFDLHGVFIAEYKDGKTASELTNTDFSSIRTCLIGKIRATNNFQWSYDRSYNVNYFKSFITIYVYDKFLNLLHIFNGINEASIQLNISKGHISQCCNKVKNHSKYILSYEKLY